MKRQGVRSKIHSCDFLRKVRLDALVNALWMNKFTTESQALLKKVHVKVLLTLNPMPLTVLFRNIVNLVSTSFQED